MMKTNPDPVQLLLVTGPLGSGKTTVVNRILKEEICQQRNVAVLINEFGTIDVDGGLLSTQRPELADVASLLGGCACCSLRSDVVETLAAWCGRPAKDRPERIVLETTGLADPTDLLDLEQEPVLQGRLQLAGCLTVVSALTPLRHAEFRELLRHQIALASTLYVSKSDLDPSAAMAWESHIRSHFGIQDITQTIQGEAPEGSPDPWRGGCSHPAKSTVRSGPSYAEAHSLSLRWDHPVDPEALEALFQAPPPPGEVLRAKGVASFKDWPPRVDGSDRWAFQVADGRVEIMPLSPMPGGALQERVAVVIGTGLDTSTWKSKLRAMERPHAGARRKVPLKRS